MFTKQYAEMVRCLMTNGSWSGTTISGSTFSSLPSTSPRYCAPWLSVQSDSGGGNFFHLSNDTSVMSPDDTTIPNRFSDVVGRQTATTSKDSDGNPYVQFSIIFNNNSGSDITATRIYYTKGVATSSSQYENPSQMALLWEDDLSEPITIANGASYNYVVKMYININDTAQ